MKTVIIKEDKYKVTVDRCNHTLYKFNPGGYTTGKGVKKPAWEFEGYFPNMTQVLASCVVMEAVEDGTTVTLEKYVDQLSKLAEKYDGILDQLT